MSADNLTQPSDEQENGFECPAFVEPTLLFIAIICVTLLLGAMQMRDEKAKQAEAKKEYLSKCHWHQPRQITEFDCVVINQQLAVIK